MTPLAHELRGAGAGGRQGRLDKHKLRDHQHETFDTINGPVKFNGVENATTPASCRSDQKFQIVWPKESRPRRSRLKMPGRPTAPRPIAGMRGFLDITSGQLLLAAIITGTIYATVGLGLNLVYGTMRLSTWRMAR